MPDAVVAALSAQLAPHRISMNAGTPPDVMITGDAAKLAPDEYRGVPVLEISKGRKNRLGAVVREALQMAAESALYIDPFPLGDAVLHPQEKSLETPAGVIALTDREVDILAYLARHAGRSVGRDEMLSRVWRYQADIDTHTLETHIYRLRQKLGAYQDRLVTDAAGYRLIP